MGFIAAIILGFVQGITEFLPVSSSGHLVLARSFLRIIDGDALAFDAMLHLSTALAAIVYFWRDLSALVHAFLRYVGRMPVDGRDVALVFALIAGTIPAAIAGFLLEDMLEYAVRSPLIVAGVLTLGSILFGVAEYVYRRRRSVTRQVTVRTGLLVGLFQALALAPGVSRSGASIAGGMLLGLSRGEATRFAFLLAIPVILGAGLKKSVELLSPDVAVAWGPALAGAAVAFVVGLFAIHCMITYLRTHTLWPFIWYRLFLAVAVVLFVFYG